MTAITGALTSALLEFVWQGCLVAALLWVALYLLRKRSPEARYAASCGALALLVLLPVATAWTQYAGATPGIAIPAAMAAWPVDHIKMGTAWLALVQSWALPAWSLGVLLFSLRLLWGCRQAAALKGRGEPAGASLFEAVTRVAERLELTRPVRVVVTAAAEVPGVAGYLRPVLLLPLAALCGLTPPQLEAVLAHELAHIRRRDPLLNLLQVMAETLLFYHPAVWWTSARIRHERELCCDDVAVRTCGDALGYARALTTLERLRVAPATALGSTGGPLLYRIQRLLGTAPPEYGWSKAPGIFALAFAMACIALNLNQAGAQAPSTPSPAPAQSQAQSDPEAAVRFLEEQIRMLEQQPDGSSASVQEQIQALKNKVEMARGLLEARGRALKGIVVTGMADSTRAALLSRLAMHNGDTLTWDSMRAVATTVRQFDPHLEFTVVLLPGRSAELRIHPAVPAATSK